MADFKILYRSVPVPSSGQKCADKLNKLIGFSVLVYSITSTDKTDNVKCKHGFKIKNLQGKKIMVKNRKNLKVAPNSGLLRFHCLSRDDQYHSGV